MTFMSFYFYIIQNYIFLNIWWYNFTVFLVENLYTFIPAAFKIIVFKCFNKMKRLLMKKKKSESGLPKRNSYEKGMICLDGWLNHRPIISVFEVKTPSLHTCFVNNQSLTFVQACPFLEVLVPPPPSTAKSIG